MRTTNLEVSAMKALAPLFLALALLGGLAGAAQAAPAPAPAWKLLAVTGPTHLPPMQSEVQRVAVEEAEGGTFTLSREAGEGTATPVTRTGGKLTYANGATTATIASEGILFEPGQRIASGAKGVKAGTRIVSCSPDCIHEGSTVELSQATNFARTAQAVTLITKELTAVTGTLGVGDELSGGTLEAETYVTAAGSGTAVLSVAPGVTTPITFAIREVTAPIPYNASASEVQSALDELPAFPPGSFTVRGGPGDERPFSVTFGANLANQDVEQLNSSASGLTGQHAFVRVTTPVPGGPGTGEILILPANVGGKATTGTVTVTLGPLPQGIVTAGAATGSEWICPGGAGESTVTCTSTRSFSALHSSAFPVDVPVEVTSAAAPNSLVHAEISGGGAARSAGYELPIVVSGEPAPFGLAAEWAGSFEADGTPSVQAGGHPYSGAAYFIVNTVRSASGEIVPAGDSHDVFVDLPPGFVGNPLATKRCPQSVVVEPMGGSEQCNLEMSVGTLVPYLGFFPQALEAETALFNDMPPRGFAAEFSSQIAFPVQSVLASVNSEEDFGIRLTAASNPNFDKIFGAFTAFEGVPKFGNGQALLSNPVNCAESAERPPMVRIKADSWQDRGRFSETVALPQPTLVGCGSLEFKAQDLRTKEGQVGFSFQPTSTRGSSPVGATAHLHIDQAGLTAPGQLTTPQLRRSVLKLPAGLSLNPSSASGLQGCSEAQMGYRGKNFPMPAPIRFTATEPTCPDGSKLGTAKIETPLLDGPLMGTVYLAAQEENPFGSLLAVYLVVDDPVTGVILKLPGEVQADSETGRLTAVFDNSPQLPFEDLTLHFRGDGPRAEFATSAVCGTYGSEGTWTPWSAPESGAPAQTTDSFEVSGNCSSSAASRPFAPSFEAGAADSVAGAYSPLIVKVARSDGEQELKRFDFTMPPGFTGKLAGIPYCSEDQIHQAEAKTGKEERANPSCPVASRLGTLQVGAGVGSEPIHVGGNLYLAGPYKGAPVSAVAVTPALAGPYDLGDVVVRTPIYIDPVTAQLTAKSDPIPTILRGIPLKIRSVAISADREAFTLNPTSCEAMSVTASLAGSSGATARPSNRFQVGGCDKLGFGPKLTLGLKGSAKRGGHPARSAIRSRSRHRANAKRLLAAAFHGHSASVSKKPTKKGKKKRGNRLGLSGSMKRGGNPALHAVVRMRDGSANIARASVALPHSAFLDQSHIRTICTRVQFAAGNGHGSACPAGSVYGHVTARSPLLDYALEGNVYLRSSSHPLPDLVPVLEGPAWQPLAIVLVGRIDSKNGGIRTTFEGVPDAPVSEFVLDMQGGKRGLIENSRNLCKSTVRATAVFDGQNGKRATTRPVVKPECSKQRRKAHKRRGHSRR